MSELQIFKNKEFGEVRTLIINGEPYFVGKDVCSVFGDTNYRRSLTRLDDEDKSVSQISTPGGMQQMTVVNESGLYSLLFYMQPKKAKGVSQNDTLINERVNKLKKFKRWVTSEVLPTIRKTGGYVNNEEQFVESYFPNADTALKSFMISTLSEVKRQNRIIENQKREIEYKEDVIIGLVDNIAVSDKRQILNRVVRKGGKYQERWNTLYREFENKYHINIKVRMNNYNESHKPKIKNKLDYVDKVMNKIPDMYEIACKLYENDIKELVQEMYELNNINTVE